VSNLVKILTAAARLEVDIGIFSAKRLRELGSSLLATRNSLSDAATVVEKVKDTKSPHDTNENRIRSIEILMNK